MTHSSVADCGRFAEDSRATAFPPLPPPPDVRNRTRKDLISRALKYVPPHRKQISRRQFLVLFFFFFSFFAFVPSAVHTTRQSAAQGSGSSQGSEPPPRQRRKPGRVPVSCAECRRCVPHVLPFHSGHFIAQVPDSPDSS